MSQENSYRSRIEAYIDEHKEDILADLCTLVRIDSQRREAQEGKPYGEGPARVLDEAGEMMRSYGLKVTDYAHYVVTGDLGEGPKMLDILAHLDVVPVTDEWTVTAPFEPKIVDGKIYGRGTADDKGPAIAALYAIRAIKDLSIPLRSSVRLILGSDEECGSSDLAYYFGIEKEAPYTFTPDADFPLINLEKGRLAKSFTCRFEDDLLTAEGIRLICLEGGDKVTVVPQNARAVVAGIAPEVLEEAALKTASETGTKIRVGTEGANCSVHVRGTAAHGSTPELGCNAVTALLKLLSCLAGDSTTKEAKVIRGLDTVFAHGDTRGEAAGIAMEDEAAGKLTLNLGVLRIEEGSLYGEFDVRAPLCANDENLTEVMRASLQKAGVTMEAGGMKKPHYVPEDLPFIRILLESYEHYSGLKGECLSTGGGTYVHDLERGVAFGCVLPGVDNHMHGDDEFMVIDDLIMSAKIFADVIVRMCG